MSTIIGLVIVFGSVLGGFAMAHGPFAVLVQPNELVVIGGAALGALIISAPGKAMSRVKLAQQDQSSIFKNYNSLISRHHALVFLVDALKQLVDGCTPEELAMLLDVDMETLHEEEHQPISLIRSTSDALPGLGIVAAVLGIIITMGHLDGGPEVIGHHVGAALVGTFIGILLCYGMLGPIAQSIELQVQANGKYIQCIKDGVLAAARGAAPAIAVEFSRRCIFNDERPSFAELDAAIQSLKSGG
jgi:chemotaxis protein MotA